MMVRGKNRPSCSGFHSISGMPMTTTTWRNRMVLASRAWKIIALLPRSRARPLGANPVVYARQDYPTIRETIASYGSLRFVTPDTRRRRVGWAERNAKPTDPRRNRWWGFAAL